MHYYQHHIGDFIRDTSRLTDQQCMAYMRLIWMYYESEQPLPNEIDVLALRVGCTESDASLILRAFFKRDGDVWRHTRCDKEIAAYHQMHDAASKAGKASAAKRALNKQTTYVEQPLNERLSDVEQASNERAANGQLTNNQQPITNNQLSKDNKRVALSCPDDVGQQVWADWIALRKSKKAPATQTALDGIAKEASIAGVTLEQALSMCCERGWTGFKASWLQERKQGNTQVAETAYQRSMRLRMQEAVPQIAAVDPSIHAGDFFRTIEMVEVVR